MHNDKVSTLFVNGLHLYKVYIYLSSEPGGYIGVFATDRQNEEYCVR
jgi:hypothetical protein